MDPSDAGTPNCCGTEVAFTKFFIAWNIKNFSFCRQARGDSLASCIFTDRNSPGSLKFRLRLYPRGTEKNPDDLVVSLSLVTDKEEELSLVKYDCLFLGADQKTPYCITSGETVMRPGEYNLNLALIKREELFSKKDELLPEDKLTLICAVKASHAEKTALVDIDKATFKPFYLSSRL